MKILFRFFVISLGIISLCSLTCSNSAISESIDGYWWSDDEAEAISINGKEGIRLNYDTWEFPTYATLDSLFNGIDANDGTVQYFNVTPKVIRDTKKPSDRISGSCWNLVKGFWGEILEEKKTLDEEDQLEIYYLGSIGSMSGETEYLLCFSKRHDGKCALWEIRCDLLEGEYDVVFFDKIDKNTNIDDRSKL